MSVLDRRLAWSVFALLLASYAYFYQGGGWNENSRLDLVRAIVDDHSLAIDRYQGNTGDKAHFEGHYYSDKAPGLSFVAAPIYALASALRPLFRTEHDFVVLAAYLVTVLTVGASGAALGALVYRSGRKLGATRRGAVVGAVGYGLGTGAFPLSTMFFGHQLAALLLFGSFSLAWDGKTQDDSRRGVAVALLASFAVLVEFPTAPAALGILFYHAGPRLSRRTVGLAVAAALPVLALALYLGSAFSSPITVGYDLLADAGSRAEMHSHGFFGVSYPHIAVLAELLFGRYRGLLPYSPLLILALPGFLSLLTGHDTGEHEHAAVNRAAVQVALGVIAYYLLFVSSYEWWQGGASFGSRHLAPMLPFLAMPVSVVASRRPQLGAVLLTLSTFVMLVVVSVHPKPSEWLEDPFWAWLLPRFAQGSLAITRACPVFGSPTHPGHHPFLSRAPFDAWNLGMVIGGRGLRSLVPLLSLWLTAAWALAKETGPGAGEARWDLTGNAQADASASATSPRSDGG